MEMPCIYCGQNTDRLEIVQYVRGSAGVIRPVCEFCNKAGLCESRNSVGTDGTDTK